MNADLEYLADCIFIEALAKDDSLIVLSQQDIMGSVAESIKNYVSNIYDPNRKLASIMAFIGPTLLWKLNFPWLSVLYTVAEALGFDWKSFWSDVGRGIARFVRAITNSGAKATPDEMSTQVNDVVSTSFNDSFTGEIDKVKLMNVALQNKLGADISNAIELKVFAIEFRKNKNLIKTAQASLLRRKLARFFIKTITWLVKTALISLGFGSAAAAVSGLMGAKTEESGGGENTLQVSPNVPPEMFQVHPNDLSNNWVERVEISDIDSVLNNWILSIYPQLSGQINDIQNSSSYQSVANNFRSRNRLATGLGILSIPKPYQRKTDIVSAIINGYLREHPQKSTEQPSNNPAYK